ncbi:MAG: Hpt domain-containing protein, partial [Thioalkalispiraceae bacterium]
MNEESIQEKLEKVRLSYISALAEKRDMINSNWANLQDNWNPQDYDHIYRLIHGIAGSAETFGFPELTVKARAALDDLKEVSNSQPDSTLLDSIENKIFLLCELLQKISK